MANDILASNEIAQLLSAEMPQELAGWSWLTQRYRDLLGIANSDVEALNSALGCGYFSQLTAFSSPEYCQRICGWWESYFSIRENLSTLLDVVDESSFVRPETLTTIGQHRVSPDFLRLLAYQRLIAHANLAQRPGPIVEIGGGYGALARIIKAFSPDRTIIVVDLPTSLVFAFLFLRLNHPTARILVWTSPDRLPELSAWDFVLLSCFALEALQEDVSLLINTWSMGEMPTEHCRSIFELFSGSTRHRLGVPAQPATDLCPR